MSANKEQLLSNPRSKEIRQICLDIADATDNILHKPDVDTSLEYTNLERLNRKLIELGITPHMHTGLGQSAYDDPVTLAEYVAGQWIDQLGKQFPSEKSIVPLVQEHSEGQAGNPHVLSNKNIPPKLKDFMVMRSFVNITYRFLDAEYHCLLNASL